VCERERDRERDRDRDRESVYMSFVQIGMTRLIRRVREQRTHVALLYGFLADGVRVLCVCVRERERERVCVYVCVCISYRLADDSFVRFACESSAHTLHAFVYFLQLGAGVQLDGVSMALLCGLMRGLKIGPAFSANGGVLTCHRYPRYCESWLHYHPGTRVEV